MARTADEVIVEVRARTAEAERNLNRYAGTFSRSMGQSNRALEQHERRIRASAGNVSALLKGMAAGVAAGFSAGAVIQMADAYTNLQNRLRATGLEGRELVRVEEALYEAANRNGIAVDSVAQLFQRASLSRDALGASNEQLISLTNGVTAALRVQGVSAQQASGPLLQLGQALGAGTVRAEELNSLLEGTPVILQAAANGSKRFAGDMNALTRAVRDGKVSSQELFQALLAGLPALEQQAANLPKTVGQALQTLNNELGRYVGQTDQSLSATERLAQGIEALADNLDRIIPVITTLVTFVGVRWAGALTAAAVQGGLATASAIRYQLALAGLMARQTGATTAQVALNGALMANPIGLVITLVAALTAGLVFFNQQQSEAAIRAQALADVEKRSEPTKTKMRQLTQELATASRDRAAAIREEIAELINLQRIETSRARERFNSAKREARETAAIFGEEDQAGEAVMYEGVDIGAAPETRDTRRARAEYQAEIGVLRALEEAANDAETARRRVSSPAPGGGGSASDRRRREAEERRRAELRQSLDLEERLAAVRASGDDKAIRAEEERQRLIELTARYREAGYADAEARATNLLALENRIFQVEEERAALAKAKEASEEALVEQARREAAILEDALRYEAELARLRGDPRAMEQAERELFINERINELLAQRPGLTEDAARAQAGSEWQGYRDADREGDMREEFRRSFRDGIKAAIDGDLGSAFESLADRFTDRMLDNLADDLFNLLSNAFSGASGGGGGILSAIGGLFGGFRANGGPVSPGKAFVVGEKRPELFVPKTAGTILPNVNALTASVGRAAQRQIIEHRVIVVPEEASFIRLASDAAGPVAAGAVAQAGAGMANQQRQARYRTRR